MIPARERLETDDLAGRQFDQRLEREMKLVAFDRPAQFGFEAEPAARGDAIPRLVNLGMTGALCPPHRELRIADKVFGDFDTRRHHRAADGAVDLDLELAQAD